MASAARSARAMARRRSAWVNCRSGWMMLVASTPRIIHPGRQFTQADLRLAMALADRAALAIENSQLYAQERRLRQKLEDLNQAVQEANRLKTEFVTVVTH